jgi:flavin-dependent dehydrogenase
MSDFDVIVIGGGPAGCYAALTAATKGCRVAIFEEHGTIGRPRHGPGWLMESDFAKSVINAIGNAVICTSVKEYRISNAESGELIEKSTLGGYLVRRDLLDKEVAALAIQAGASLYLKTKVLKLTRKGGKVEGVETSSSIIPRAKGEIFICADGIRSAGNGFAAGEGLCERSEVQPAISYLLANAEVPAGMIEIFLSSDPVLNYRALWAHGDGVCYLSLPASTPFQELRERQDNVMSRKIKNAHALEISGYAMATRGKYGQFFKNMVKDNIMFVGDASGSAGNIHGMIQGQFAGRVAASAIKDNDISEQRLSEYQDLVLNTLGKAPFFYFSAREDFGSFDNWFRKFEESTKGIKATELTPSR